MRAISVPSQIAIDLRLDNRPLKRRQNALPLFKTKPDLGKLVDALGDPGRQRRQHRAPYRTESGSRAARSVGGASAVVAVARKRWFNRREK